MHTHKARHPAIILEGVSFSYGHHAVLSGIDLAIIRESFTGIIGRNGAGKTTLLRLMLGSLTPDSGTITRPDAARGEPIGYVGQGPIATRLPLTAFEATAIGYPGKDRAKRAEEALETMGMAAFSRRLYRELSGGQKQKVQIARCLASGARIILLDEPTAALDETAEAEFMAVLDAMKKAKALTVAMISHDRALFAGRADRVVTLDRGTVSEAGA